MTKGKLFLTIVATGALFITVEIVGWFFFIWLAVMTARWMGWL